MKKRIFGALGGLIATAGLAVAQQAAPPTVALPSQLSSPTYAPVDAAGGDFFAGGYGDADGSAPRLWGGAEYLLWWVRSGPGTPVVLTTTTNPTFDFVTNPNPGAIGAKGTIPVLGGHDLDYGAFSGLRLTLGGWLNDDSTLGVEANGFLLERRSTISSVSTAGGADSPSYFVPFTGVGAFPGNVAAFGAGPGTPGAASLQSNTRLWGTETNVVLNLQRGGGLTLDALVGSRFLSLEENLNYYTSSSFGDGAFNTTTADSYGTQNRFYGGQIGARADYSAGLFFATATAKVALGDSREGIAIGGETTSVVTGEKPFVSQGGTFTNPLSNIGRATQDKFAVVPELQLNLGVRLGDSLRAFVGYDFLYWSDVARPGNQVDTRFDTTFAPGKIPSAPVNPRVSSDFWAQGINFGVEVRY